MMTNLTPELVDEIFAKSKPEIANYFKRFNEKHASTFNFEFVSNAAKNKLGQRVSENLEVPELTALLIDTIRLISRDRPNVEHLLPESLIDGVLTYAGIFKKDGFPKQADTILSALKLTNNGMLGSKRFQNAVLIPDEPSQWVLEYIEDFQNPSSAKNEWIKKLCSESPRDADEVYAFYTKVLFLTTSMSTKFQKYCSELPTFVKTVVALVSPVLLEKVPTAEQTTRADNGLMVFFNVFCHFSAETRRLSPEEARPAITLFRDIILRDGDLFEPIVTGAINALSVPPVPCDVEIMCVDPAAPPTSEANANLSNMRFTETLLNNLEQKLDAVETLKRQGARQRDIDEQYSLTGPLCQLLGDLCSESKYARRHVRMRILPPLTADQVETTADQQDTFRGKLVRVVATPTTVKDIVTQLLFILCKRSVPRMIKYVGFGHSAGHLANMGLLGQINQKRRDSDSENSETEDYQTVSDNVNPVTGAIWQEQLPNPFDEMTDEQKEFEAMKLVDCFDKLLATGVVKPGSIGADGKVKEVSHVMELVKDVPDAKEHESDTD